MTSYNITEIYGAVDVVVVADGVAGGKLPPPQLLVDFVVEISLVSVPSPFLYFTEYAYELPQDNPLSAQELVRIQPEFPPPEREK